MLEMTAAMASCSDLLSAHCINMLQLFKLNLVLFTDALLHLMRASRLMAMARGSGLLVGVGGSGKQSLARLAAYINGATTFQITVTKVSCGRPAVLGVRFCRPLPYPTTSNSQHIQMVLHLTVQDTWA